MSAIRRDDLLRTLEYSFNFFGKTFDPVHLTIWLDALSNFEIADIREAFRRHTLAGRYAPKPVDILDQLAGMGISRLRPRIDPQPSKPCPPEKAEAWIWTIGEIAESGRGPLAMERMTSRPIKLGHTMTPEHPRATTWSSRSPSRSTGPVTFGK